jgi:hypothetical protein
MRRRGEIACRIADLDDTLYPSVSVKHTVSGGQQNDGTGTVPRAPIVMNNGESVRR